MSQESSPPSIPSGGSSPVHNNTSNNNHHHDNDNPSTDNDVATATTTTPATVLTRSNRPSRACTIRTAARLYSALTTAGEQQRKSKVSKKDQLQQQQQQREEDESPHQCSGNSKIVTQLVGLPEPSQLPRWTLRSMWELASILNFLHIFRPLLNILVEFSAEEFETALITPNDTLSDIHIPLLKAIPPVTRMALTRDTWITVLCRKLRDWWDWVAEGDLPIVASHGVEIETYKTLDPWVRVVILKALCDIRVEQDDIKSYIDSSLKHGVQLSAFRNERIGGDSQGISYWYEDDPIIGHRLYREMRKTEVKRAKTKGSHVLSCTSYKWETVATNFDEFHDVSEKLSSSKNRTEASLGKKLKIDMLPEIEKVHKRKERLLKKQHRQALLLDNFVSVDGFGPGRSLRGRKPVTYTFDDFDRSINEAIKITKRNPEPLDKRGVLKTEVSANGKWSDSSNASPHVSFSAMTPESLDYIDADDEHNPDHLDPSNHRRRQKPQRYSEREFVEAISDNEADFDSDDDIVGEAIYDEEYLKKRKQRKFSSSSEGDEEYCWDDENAEDEEDEEEEEEDSLGISEESDEPQKFKKLPSRTRRETKLRSVGELQSGLRRSRRATRNQINYRQYELSESETESMKLEKANASDKHLDAIENGEYSEGSQDFDGIDDDEEKIADLSVHDYPEAVEKEQNPSPEKSNIPGQDEIPGRKRRFLDLNELAPVSGFDDGPSPSTIMKDDTDDI